MPESRLRILSEIEVDRVVPDEKAFLDAAGRTFLKDFPAGCEFSKLWTLHKPNGVADRSVQAQLGSVATQLQDLIDHNRQFNDAWFHFSNYSSPSAWHLDFCEFVLVRFGAGPSQFLVGNWEGDLRCDKPPAIITNALKGGATIKESPSSTAIHVTPTDFHKRSATVRGAYKGVLFLK